MRTRNGAVEWRLAIALEVDLIKNKPLMQIDKAYKDIRTILETAHAKTFKAINTAMVQAYWHIGRIIVDGFTPEEIAVAEGKVNHE